MDNVDILWLTRGVSFGHATRDTAVLSALQLARPELQIHFVSYANGFACLRQHCDAVGFVIRVVGPTDRGRASKLVFKLY
jgi:hypothetical protein